MPRNECKFKKDLRKYYNEIRNCMPYSSRQSSKLLKDLCMSIDDYVNKHPSSQIQDVMSNFGSPEEIAAYSISNLEPKELKRKLGLKRYVFIGITSILLMFTFIYVAAYIRGKDSTAFYETTNIDIVEIYVEPPIE